MARVLVADDQPQLRRLVRLLLESAGHRVREAAGGAEALRELRRGPPDLLLCDLFMPGVDGLEVLRAARLDHPALPVVAMSGGGFHGLADVLRVAEHLGAVRTLGKPFGRQALLAAVDEALRAAAAA